MSKFLVSLLIGCGAIALLPLTSLTQAASRRIPASYAQGQNNAPLQTLKLWSGYGLNLSFIPTGEVITKAWLDDPTQIGMDFDAVSCAVASAPSGMQSRGTAQGTRQADCPGSGATVIHFRRITPVKFPQLLASQGRTTLQVITQTRQQQRRLYQFHLVLATGTPEYVTVEIVPDRPTQSMADRTRSTQLLVAVQSGLLIAERQKQISRSQPLWGRVKQFITLARSGIPTTEAAQAAGVSLPLIQKLAEMGTLAPKRTPSSQLPTNPTELPVSATEPADIDLLEVLLGK